MELQFKTPNPVTLRNDIIKKTEDGEFLTWEIYNNSDEKYLKHTGQWGEKGVIKLTANDREKVLAVEVLKFDDVEEDLEDFEGYYLGRFCELMLVNFPNRFTRIDKI